jgi:hypothetical protein
MRRIFSKPMLSAFRTSLLCVMFMGEVACASGYRETVIVRSTGQTSRCLAEAESIAARRGLVPVFAGENLLLGVAHSQYAEQPRSRTKSIEMKLRYDFRLEEQTVSAIVENRVDGNSAPLHQRIENIAAEVAEAFRRIAGPEQVTVTTETLRSGLGGD